MSKKIKSELLIGTRFGLWVVTGPTPTALGAPARSECKCGCGTELSVLNASLRNGSSTGCGCTRLSRTANINKVHGMTATPTYAAWKGMWQRCTDPNQRAFVLYEQRRPPQAWRDFEAFLNDMGPKPGSGWSIERVDNSKPYGPSNCVWATRKEQARNTTRNQWLELNGTRMLAMDWANVIGINHATLHWRIKKWGLERALSTPKQGNKS